MFFNKEKKQIEALITLFDRLEFRVEALQEQVATQEIRLNAITKLYPHGIKKNGEPRNKAGRPRKVVEA
jgi:hypothetical protein